MKKQQMLFQIPTLFGLEGICADELKYLGFADVKADNGKVFFTGGPEEMARANLWTRTGERVQIVMAQFHAETFDELFEGTKDTPFENFIGSLDAFPVKGWSLNSKLHSVPDCQKIVKKAVVERLKECYGNPWFEETGPKIQIQFSIMKDEVTLLLDTSGSGLYKRGYRRNETEAPIRETLAAGIVNLARVHADSCLADPMCGSGTIVIEGAMKALNIAPGIRRHYSFENWACFSKSLLADAREEAMTKIKKDAPFEAFGCDIDESVIEIAKENAKRAGVASRIQFMAQDIKYFRADQLPSESDRGVHKKQIVCTNPPYGERLLDVNTARELYKKMGVVFPPLDNHGYYIITPDEAFEENFGRKADKVRKLYNGMLKCNLYFYYRSK